MKVADFDFQLDESLIAQTPLEKRDASRLLVLDRKSKQLTHTTFPNLLDYLQPGDVLVRNITKVIPARLYGIKEGTGAHVELLLLHQEKDIWTCLVGNARVVKLGTKIVIQKGILEATCVGVEAEGIRLFSFHYEGVFYEVLSHIGTIPLPPYIKESLQDWQRYQTIYAQTPGSAAAPTAGLHFTPEILAQVQAKGVEVVDITLHVGLGTFRPVKVTTIAEHKMHEEYYEISNDSAQKLQTAYLEKRRILAIGTTSVRTLEANFGKYGHFQATHEATDIFIYPGYRFQVVSGMITNFHLPKSTLLMLVSAFAGLDFIQHAYQVAIQERYRFFSFGDSMVIL